MIRHRPGAMTLLPTLQNLFIPTYDIENRQVKWADSKQYPLFFSFSFQGQWVPSKHLRWGINKLVRSDVTTASYQGTPHTWSWSYAPSTFISKIKHENKFKYLTQVSYGFPFTRRNIPGGDHLLLIHLRICLISPIPRRSIQLHQKWTPPTEQPTSPTQVSGCANCLW